MSDPFGPAYAETYDALYADKDYAGECDMLERAFAEYGVGRILRVLDLGCGTGAHAVPLALRGYEVAGVDRSPAMLDHARARVDSAAGSVDVEFHQGDITTHNIGGRFDAAIMMFAVLGYLTEPEAVAAALRNARTHLRGGGLLIFDAWYAPSVLSDPPQPRWRMVPHGAERILRLTTGTTRADQQLCEVSFQLLRIRGNRILNEFSEQHTVRFFSTAQIEAVLRDSGFQLLRLGSFPDYSADPGGDGWSVCCIARADGEDSAE